MISVPTDLPPCGEFEFRDAVGSPSRSRGGGTAAACRWFRVPGSLTVAGGALLAAVLLFGTGCAGYKLGPTGEFRAGQRSVQVNPVHNATLEPRLGPAVTQALRKQLQRDGTLRLDTRDTGDVIVNTEIIRYHRRELAFVPYDTLTAQDYELNVYARVTATSRHSGREILNKEVRGHTLIRVGPDLASAERQALPLLAEDLARRITGLLVDGEW